MRAKVNTRRIATVLIASTIVVVLPNLAAAEEPYKRVTVAELKAAQKRQAEEQKRLEATSEYRAKKRAEEAARKHREQDAAKERELRLRMLAADLERKQIENKRLASRGTASSGGSGGSGAVVVVPNYVNVPRITVVPSLGHPLSLGHAKVGFTHSVIPHPVVVKHAPPPHHAAHVKHK
jgi:hypothetical protein